MTLAEIRAHYPAPRQQTGWAMPPGAYCVGAAVLLAHGLWSLDNGFPGEHALAAGLRELNPALVGQPPQEAPDDGLEEEDRDRAYELAAMITGLNDTGNFAAAWRVAEIALGGTSA